MFLSNFLKLGLYKSSCILFSCLFFVSCNTVSSKPTEIVSNAGSRKIASASAAAMAVNSSAFLAMQACPVLASIQSRIPSWRGTPDRDEHIGRRLKNFITNNYPDRDEHINRYNAEYVMNMLQETDGQGRTLHQRLMLELSSNSDCLSRIGDLRENICFYREYSEACDALHKLDKLDGETIIQEFEEFAGASIESIDPSQLVGKLDGFIQSRGLIARFFHREPVLYKEPSSREEELEQLEAEARSQEMNFRTSLITAPIILALLSGIHKAAATTAGAAAVGAVGTVGATVVTLAMVGGVVWLATGGFDKRLKNRLRPRAENP